MWGRFTLFDAALAAYFILLFEPRWLGYLIALIIIYRIFKDVWAPSDKLVLDMGRHKRKQPEKP